MEAHRRALPVFIDDAAPEILHARFARTESSLSSLGAMEEERPGRHGIPAAVCTGRHTAFAPHARDGARGESQLGRVFRLSGSVRILSLSPQSEGRAECAHLSAQQRLLRELANALAGMSFADEDAALAAANDHLDGWVGHHNRRFAVAPSDASDAHVPLMLDASERRQLFSVRVGRRLAADRVFSHEGSRHVVESLPSGVSLRGACRAGVTVHVRPDGERFVSALGVEAPTREVSCGRAGAAAVGGSRSGAGPSLAAGAAGATSAVPGGPGSVFPSRPAGRPPAGCPGFRPGVSPGRQMAGRLRAGAHCPVGHPYGLTAALGCAADTSTAADRMFNGKRVARGGQGSKGGRNRRQLPGNAVPDDPPARPQRT